MKYVQITNESEEEVAQLCRDGLLFMKWRKITFDTFGKCILVDQYDKIKPADDSFFFMLHCGFDVIQGAINDGVVYKGVPL